MKKIGWIKFIQNYKKYKNSGKKEKCIFYLENIYELTGISMYQFSGCNEKNSVELHEFLKQEKHYFDINYNINRKNKWIVKNTEKNKSLQKAKLEIFNN
jgi:hypothetical protein